ncbi:MAG: metallophosphoesterase family protein [Oscillospiraceae bacterium]|nr:metallophosphoesterase family protein [Oscillospiraceae bacterium]
MSAHKTAHRRLSEVFRSSKKLNFNNASKIVLMSDCHRGDGSWTDSFAHNHSIYYSALKHYYSGGYTYIELGDGDELWKNKSLADISRIYADVFRLLSRFHTEDRLHVIFGNHDMGKRELKHSGESLFENIDIHEGLILCHKETQTKLFLIHGHQGSLLDDRFWRLNRFLVRHIVRRLEMLGFKDLTSAAKNNVKKRRAEKRMSSWAAANGQIVISGHTHRPACFPDSNTLYYNDGSCVHPNCITCIEIINGKLSLYKWSVKSRDDGSLYVGKDLIAVPREL